MESSVQSRHSKNLKVQDLFVKFMNNKQFNTDKKILNTTLVSLKTEEIYATFYFFTSFSMD